MVSSFKPSESSEGKEDIPPKKLCETWNEEAVKDYHSPEIADVVRNEAKKVYENSDLKMYDVTNIKFKLVEQFFVRKSYYSLKSGTIKKSNALWLVNLTDSVHTTNKHGDYLHLIAVGM
ncbi:3893_t:CDS:2 [Gigaspora margarita]|uniref:3893_t:CDS:1 n=1 Tax=Gigaspora margarita TaxID=4874 RepID=A0ABN7UXL8_GIGMA|nr:3893_t:CDS:2 [Gigaspora margarita]